MRQKLQSSRLDIHNIDNDIESCLKTLESELSAENWKLVSKYNILLTASTISKAARRGNLRLLLSLSRLYENKPWESITKDDVDLLAAKIMQIYSPDGQESWSTRNHKSTLAQFIRWIKLGSRDKDDVGDPPELKNVKIRTPREKLKRDDLPDEKEQANWIAATPHLQIKALIDCTKEASQRVAGMLTLKIRNAQFDENGAIVSFEDKTGVRPVRLVTSAKTLFNWYNAHPFKNDPNYWLFTGINKNTYDQRLKYGTARYHIVEAAKKAKIHKRVYFHLLRHAGCTDAANYLTEAQMRKRHGWSKNSPMPGRYVHLVNADVETAVLKHHGLSAPDQKPTVKKCHFCDWINNSDADRCEKCTKPLDLKAALKSDEKHTADIKKIVDEALLENMEQQRHKALAQIQSLRLIKQNEDLQKQMQQMKKQLLDIQKKQNLSG